MKLFASTTPKRQKPELFSSSVNYSKTQNRENLRASEDP